MLECILTVIMVAFFLIVLWEAALVGIMLWREVFRGE